MSSKIISARMQGNLDGLCGVYSVVNASLNLPRKKLNKDQISQLFRELCSDLDKKGKLKNALLDGIKVKPLGRLIDTASRFLSENGCGRMKHSFAFESGPKGLAEFWDRISAHIEKNSAGSVILCIEGKYEHWTCIENITEKTIKLIDSSGLKNLRRKQCTVAAAKNGRHHVFLPTETYLLQAEDS